MTILTIFSKRLHSLLSLASRPLFSSQTFHRTLQPSHYFSTHEPYHIQPLYNPIDFNDFECKNDEIHTNEIIELLGKAKNCTSRKEANDIISSCDIKPNANQIYLAIWAWRNNWEVALLAFDYCEKLTCLDDKILGLIVWVLGTHHKFDIAWSLIRVSYLLVENRRPMLAIIERYAAANYHEKAIKTFHFMEKLTVNLDQNALYTVMSALCRHGNIEEAEELMLKNKKLFSLDTEGFNIILHAWCSISVDLYEAKRVWKQMASYCITPNASSYTHMISCFSSTGNLYDSLRLYDEMKKRGWIPGLEVYNSLLYVMTRENCLNDAFTILDKIKEKGFHPDSRTYNCLICPLCEAGKFEEARSVLAALTQEGIMPTIETYHAFLKGINFERTMEILSQIKKDKVGPNGDTFLLIFDRFFKLGQPENVLKVWVEMRNYGVHPESTHYITLINGLANCGCLIKAKELYTEMTSNGFVNDPKLEKLFQLSQQDKNRGRVGHVKSARNTNSPFMSQVRKHSGRRMRGGK